MLANDFNVRKIVRALQFDQKPYMKTFTDAVVNKRSEAKMKIKKRSLLILNLAFGKICECAPLESL